MMNTSILDLQEARVHIDNIDVTPDLGYFTVLPRDYTILPISLPSNEAEYISRWPDTWLNTEALRVFNGDKDNVKVHVVGENAASPFFGYTCGSEAIEVVIVGATCDEDLLTKAYLMMSYLQSKSYRTREFIVPGMMYMECIRTNEKIRISLIRYDTIADYFNTVDIHARCVSFDGYRVSLTYGALKENTQRCIYMNLHNYSSKTAERLCRFSRMKMPFAVSFPYVKIEEMQSGEIARGLSLNLGKLVKSSLCRVGTFSLTNSSEDADTNVSRMWKFSQDYLNVSTIMTNPCGILKSDENTNPIHIEFMQQRTFADLVPREIFEQTAINFAETAIGNVGYINIDILKSVFVMKEEEIVELVRNLYRHSSVSSVRSMFISRLRNAYEKSSSRIIRFVTQNVTTQNNTPIAIHGKFARDTSDPYTSQLLLTEALGEMMKIANTKKISSCCICTGIIMEDDVILRLSCSHVFHFSATSVCEGVKRWLETDNRCPTCRAHQ